MNSTVSKNENKEDDLKFAPLNIKEPFNNPDSSWAPLINFAKPEVTNMTNNFYIGLPPVIGANSDVKLPEPTIVPAPLMPYPKAIEALPQPVQTTTTTPNSSLNKIISKDLEYPSEVNPDILYSYNQPKNFKRFNEEEESNPLHMSILRAFDFSLDNDSLEVLRECNSDLIEEIFEKLEDRNPGLFATLKAYKVPYPIASVIIKKAISFTLQSKSSEVPICECNQSKDAKDNIDNISKGNKKDSLKKCKR